MLKELHAKGVGPQSEYHLDLGSRLNLFTGDNGLGKTFILDLLWYGCTWTWADEPAHPRSSSAEPPSIQSVLGPSASMVESQLKADFDWSTERWKRGGQPSEEVAMLAIYASVQNSYAVWDTVRTPFLDGEGGDAPLWSLDRRSPVFPESYLFSRETLWNGLQFQNKPVCNGILSDIVNWQYSPKAQSKLAFQTLEKVLKELSAPDELLKFGQTMRLSTADVRDIPTILMPYGEIPIVLSSSAIRRIIEISYLLVWSWLEHLEAAKLKKLPVAKTIVLVIDEVENHLHPKWQRAILPALLRVVNCLSEDVKVQLFVTTHSPLVLASLENEVGADDKLFLLTQSNNEVTLVEEDWIKLGEASSWLTSEIFGLQQARSLEAEKVILYSRQLMLGQLEEIPGELRSRAQMEKKLREYLSPTDRFWMEWDLGECR
jgi:hypothetical protein